MHGGWADNPALTIALALAAGMLAQSLARHLRLPGIVLLLGTGVLLGPDILGIIQPESLGESLHILVGFSVAVILFEGGLNLEWRRLKRQAKPIRMLITVGAAVTAIGGALLAKWVFGASWRLSFLFGTLVIVTGPTVVTPLLRRIKVKRKLETILEAEGVLIDPVGAIIAVVALEIVTSPPDEALALGFFHLPWRLLFGALFGLAGGVLMSLLLRFRGVVPEGLESVFTLALVLAIYQGANAILPETGIVAAVMAGIVLGNSKTHVKRELMEFEEQLTVMLIGMLFVLLAADVRHAEAVKLGWPGLLVTLGLMFLVRPLNILASTIGSDLKWNEKAFLAWLAPRGIVAAAVATLFDERLTEIGITGGQEMRALVFLVIAVTVLFQGLTGGLMARILGVKRPTGRGYAILGANELGRCLAQLFIKNGQEAVLLDTNGDFCTRAEEEGLPVVYGNALEARALVQSELESRRAALGLLPNSAVNLLFASKAREEYDVPKGCVAVQRGSGSPDVKQVKEAGLSVLFAQARDLELWTVRLRRELARVEAWRLTPPEEKDSAEEIPEEPENGAETKKEPEKPEDSKRVEVGKDAQSLLLPLAHRRGKSFNPVDDKTSLRDEDEIHWLIFVEREAEAVAWLEERHWLRVEVEVAEPEPEPTALPS